MLASASPVRLILSGGRSNPCVFRRMSSLRVSKKQRTMAIQVQESVKLSNEEQRIFDALVKAERHFELGTQLRVAGGWVRDKLLGKDCHDIDIALDNMLGQDFCKRVNEYLTSIGEMTSKIGVVKSNPEQSKHLETATMHVRGVSIDFVNLRAETYAENSRIPTMEYGTPKQDAERRDLTINSLFYNINTGEVEDFTGRGIEDLKLGIIATPLEPKVTFLDDPLRVLRSIRFGARFGFELEDALKAAASSEEVRSALAKKISRERIGTEVELMLLGNAPVEAMKLLLELKLFPVVFTMPSKPQGEVPQGWERMCVLHVQAAFEVLQHFDPTKLTEEQRRGFILSALFFPLRNLTYADGRKTFPVTSFIIKESLKRKNSDAEAVIALHQSSEAFTGVVKILFSPDSTGVTLSHHPSSAVSWSESQRLEAGLVLTEIKALWRAALVLSSLHEFSENEAWNAREKAKKCVAVEEIISNLGLENVWEAKCLLNGSEIKSDLELKSGPEIKKWKALAFEWQLAHPQGTAEECRDWLNHLHAQNPRGFGCFFFKKKLFI